jgi:sugar/nucleoside kinase (ribokinase family)
VCGDVLFGQFMLDQMRRRGVNVAPVIVRPGGATGLSVILSTGVDRAILTSPGLTTALRAEEVTDALLSQARHLHVASYFLQDALRPAWRDSLRVRVPWD